MLEAAKKFRRMFVVNIDHDILGVCTSAAFMKGLNEHNRKVNSGEVKEWEKVVVYALPLLTFAGNVQTQRPVHTGIRKDLELIVRPMIMALTGVDPDEVSKEDFDKVMSIIFERDSRLFVPYAGGLSDGEKQFAFYGKITIEEAIAVLNQAAGL